MSYEAGGQSCTVGGAIGLEQQEWYYFFCWQDALMQITVQGWYKKRLQKLDRPFHLHLAAGHPPQILQP
jgi:hypothetical protein